MCQQPRPSSLLGAPSPVASLLACLEAWACLFVLLLLSRNMVPYC